MADVAIEILEIVGDPDEAENALWSMAATDVPGGVAAGGTVNVKRVDIVPGLSFLVIGGDGDADSVLAIAGDSDEEGNLDIAVPLAIAEVNAGDSLTGQSYSVDGGTVVLVQLAGAPAKLVVTPAQSAPSGPTAQSAPADLGTDAAPGDPIPSN